MYSFVCIFTIECANLYISLNLYVFVGVNLWVKVLCMCVWLCNVCVCARASVSDILYVFVVM